MKILIIDSDEPGNTFLFDEILRADPNVSVNSCREVPEVKSWLAKNPMPDIVFIPIKLAGGKAFEFFSFVKITCPVVFITEDDRYIFDALKYNCIGYLQKPIDPVKVRLLLKKYETMRIHFINASDRNVPGEPGLKKVNFNQVF